MGVGGDAAEFESMLIIAVGAIDEGGTTTSQSSQGQKLLGALRGAVAGYLYIWDG